MTFLVSSIELHQVGIRYSLFVSLSEQVIESLATQTKSGESRIGDRLLTEVIQRTVYHFSQTAVWEAMEVLQERGWIKIRNGRAIVSSMQRSQANRTPKWKQNLSF